MQDDKAAEGLNLTARQCPVIPIVEGGPIPHACQNKARARALRDDCLSVFPSALRPLLPALDEIARRWLSRSGSPYVYEIDEIAANLRFSGVWLLNNSYQWGCTALAREEDGAPWLSRSLDWPFPGLGRHTDIGRIKGTAGTYFSVTWPGYVGVLTAMAPGRFAACLNQAPMRRRMQHPWLRPCDMAANAIHTYARVREIPPDQLLRQVFEECHSYSLARMRLEQTRVALPVIYTLIGCAPGECCVIERTENEFATREVETSAANDWLPQRQGWEARMSASLLLTNPPGNAAAHCESRRLGLAQWSGLLSAPGFAWLKPPVLNSYTRLAVTMSPAYAVLRVAGFEQQGQILPEQVTQTSEIVF